MGVYCSILTLWLCPPAAGAESEELRALDQQRLALTEAVKRGDAAGLAKIFTVDAKFMLAGFEVIAGREAIQKFWEIGMNNGMIKGLTFYPIDFEVGGDLIVETGTLTTVGSDGKEGDRDNYLLVWKREDGIWKIHRDVPSKGPAAASARTTDRVGFPADYRTKFKLLGIPARETDPSQVITAYGNDQAAAAMYAAQVPFPNGAIFVMEFAAAIKDSDGKPVLDSEGRPQRGEVLHVDVMRRGKGFGEAYEENRAGEWEFASYRVDGSYSTPPAQTASCAACHLKAGADTDFVFPLKLKDRTARSTP